MNANPNARPDDALERARLQQRIVSLVSSSPLVHDGDVTGIAQLVSHQVATSLGIERVGVWLFNEAKDELICRDLYRLSADAHESGGVLRKSEFTDEFNYLVSEKYVDAHDPYTDPRTAGYVDGYLRPNRITAMLDAVVRIGEELIGTVCFEHVDRKHHWQDDEIIFASQLGDQLALTVSIARQREVAGELRKREIELSELNQVLEERIEARTASLRHAHHALLESEKLAALGRLVAGIAHEMNTPIGNALLISSTLSERIQELGAALVSGTMTRSFLTEFVDDGRKQASLIEHSLARSAALVENFKQLSVDQVNWARRKFDLHEVLEQTLQALAPRLRRAGVKVEFDVPKGIVIDGYPGPVEQILDNLTMNSLIHAFENRQDNRISIEATLADDRVRLTHTDNGVGIPLELRNKVFEPFFTTRLGQGGSGIGLAAVYNIATQLLNGNIHIEKPTEGGTRFCLEFPTCVPELHSAEALIPINEHGASAG